MTKLQTYLETNPPLIHTVVGYLMRGNEVLLGIRKRVSLGLGESLIAGIGGKLEPNETDEAALLREFMEEIHVAPTRYQRMGQATYFFPHRPQWNQRTAIYVIDAWQGEPQETTDIQPLWVQQHTLPQNQMWPDNLLTIPLILTGKTIEGAFLYHEDGSIAEYQLTES